MISNATPLICLARIRQLILLKKLFPSIAVPIEVKEEVLIEGKEGYLLLKKAFDEGWIVVMPTRMQEDFGLGKGETSAILLARERKDTIILDDYAAIKIAEIFQIPSLRTTTIILIAAQKKIITKEEALLYINELIEQGYYIAPKFYIEIVKKLKK